MTYRTVPGPRLWTRTRDLALLSATALAAGLLQPAEAARFGIVVNAVPDPILAGLAIPDTAPAMGMWSGIKPWPMNAIHLGLLPSGRVVSFGTAGGNPAVQDGRTFDTWDPYRGLAQDSHMTIGGVRGVNSFCAAQSFLADGSLLVAGGIFDDGNDKGSVVMNARGTGIAASPARLANDRYYSTMLTLPNGQQIILGGSFPYLGGWADPQGSINQGYMTGMTPEIYDGARWRSLFGANSRDAFGPDFNRFWYPRAWIAPDGRVFGISSEKMWYLNTAGNGSVTTLPFKQPQRDVGNALDAPNVGPASTAVMYDTGKILQVGGNAYSNGEGFLSSSRATIIDITGGTPKVADTAPMSVGRGWANATVLPNGHVAVTGGSKYNDRGGGDVVLQSEIWNPGTGQWSVGASGAVYRGYHSSAVLLQNGALLVAGGGAPGPVTNENAEYFYPPYLFATVNGKAALAPRPQIQSLSTLQLQYGQRMQFELTSPNGLAQVVLIGLSQTTHSFNVTQRRYVAAFTQPDAQTVTVQAPPNTNIAPPGYYQLVAVDRNGVPSPGVIVAVGAVSAPVQSSAPVVAANTGGNNPGGNNPGGNNPGGNNPGGNDPGSNNPGGTGGSALKAAHSGLCLAVPAGDASDGALVTQQPCNGKAEQSWTTRAVAGGSAFVNDATGKCLDLSLAVMPGNGSRIYQWGCHGGTNQSWIARAQGGGNAYVSARADLCLDINGASTQAGAGTIAWACHGGANQTFSSVGTSGTVTVPPVPTGAVRLEAASRAGTFARRLHGDMMAAAPVSNEVDRLESSFRVVPGLNGKGVSLQSTREPNRYIRHANFTLYLSVDRTIALPADASFTRRAPLASGCGCSGAPCVSYESVNWPGYYIRTRNDGILGIDALNDTPAYRQQASFCERP